MSTPKRALLWLMSLSYVAAGTNHFVAPDFYLGMMPDYLPWHLGLVYLSGAAEIVLGIAVLVPGLRVLAAWGIIALLLAVFPANVHVAMRQMPMGDLDPVWSWVRVPFQALFIAWAWWYTRPANRVAR